MMQGREEAVEEDLAESFIEAQGSAKTVADQKRLIRMLEQSYDDNELGIKLRDHTAEVIVETVDEKSVS